MLTKLHTFFAAGVTALMLITTTAHAATEYVDYTDIWIDANPTVSQGDGGFGINFVQSGNSFDYIFATLFIYDPATGSPVWLTGELSRPKSDTVFTGNLYKTQGEPTSDPFTPKYTKSVAVGTFKFTPTSSTTGTMEYVVSNTTVTRELKRQTLTENILNGTYWGGAIVTESKCSPSSANGSDAPSMTISVDKKTGSTQASFQLYMDNNVICTLKGTLKQEGRFSKIDNAKYTCTKGSAQILDTAADIFNIAPTTQGIEGEWKAKRVANSCAEEGHFTATIVPAS